MQKGGLSPARDLQRQEEGEGSGNARSLKLAFGLGTADRKPRGGRGTGTGCIETSGLQSQQMGAGRALLLEGRGRGVKRDRFCPRGNNALGTDKDGGWSGDRMDDPSRDFTRKGVKAD